jgi:cytochrome P450
MHPVIGGILERIVPAEGLTLSDGRFIAPGTKIGISAWVSSRDKSVYGEDSDTYRPERWLRADGESEDEFALRLKRMKEFDFTFGAGRRVCTGQHLASIELHKITATLFSHYDVSWMGRWQTIHSC